MAQDARLLITHQDFERLSQLVHRAHGVPGVEQLDEELARATVVPGEDIPENIVTMNSRVTFLDENTGKTSQVTLVYPEQADVAQGKVSVLVPVGTALIGLGVGSAIEWRMPNGKLRNLRVVSIEYQPEASGDEFL